MRISLENEEINNQMKAQSDIAMILNLFYTIFIRFESSKAKKKKGLVPIIAIYVMIRISPTPTTAIKTLRA